MSKCMIWSATEGETFVSSFHRCEYHEGRCLGPGSRTTLGMCNDGGEALKEGGNKNDAQFDIRPDLGDAEQLCDF